ncbi:hypothetical protein P0100_21855 [Yersinia pestis]|nr:hypothetical protein [Yersinia pestis]
MKKKFLAVGLCLILSLTGSSSVFAENSDNLIPDPIISLLATEGYVQVPPWTQDYTGVVDGLGQYGRITLISEGEAYAAMYKRCNGGSWQITNINDDLGWLSLGATGGTDTNNYYMNLGCQYKLWVSGSANGAKAYIRAYD